MYLLTGERRLDKDTGTSSSRGHLPLFITNTESLHSHFLSLIISPQLTAFAYNDGQVPKCFSSFPGRPLSV